jgi:hypothetical protein
LAGWFRPATCTKISSAATGKAVSVLAMAARLYLPWDATFAERCARGRPRDVGPLRRLPIRVRTRPTYTTLVFIFVISNGRSGSTLVHELRRRGGGYGVASICIGVGQGLAVVLEA